MRPRIVMRRVLACAAVTALVSAVSLAIPGPVSAAAVRVPAVSAAYTDSAAPTKSFTDPALPIRVGSWQDSSGRVHLSRSYFTYDLSAYKGATLNSARVEANESSVNDCTADRQLALWRTGPPPKKITWNNPPAERTELFSGIPVGPPDCPWQVLIDVTSAVHQALNGTGILTVELRVPAALEADPRYGRSFSSVNIVLSYNHAPDRPTGLAAGPTYCGAAPIWVDDLQPPLSANATDPDVTAGGRDPLSATFEFWQVGHSDQTTVLTQDFIGYTPAFAEVFPDPGAFVDGGKYVFRVKTNDGQADSKWSAQCRFNIDVTPPATTPVVTSTDYPEGIATVGAGGPGIPGTFTFSANHDKNIVGFRYGLDSPSEYVAADKPGGTATVSLSPLRTGINQLYVVGIDHAQNGGPSYLYYFVVAG